MKKSLIALAVLGTIASGAQAQSSIVIYGLIDTGVVYTNNVANTDGTSFTGTGSKFSMNSGVIQRSRIGFKGAEDLGNGLKALFQLEAGFGSDDGSLTNDNNRTTLFNRKAVVGLGGNFGSVLLGRQTDVLDDFSQFTSVQDFGNVTGAVGHYLDRTEGTRTTNSIRYNTPNFSGLSASFIYGLGETAGQTSAGQSFGGGVQYANGPLALFGGYYQSKLGNTPSDVYVWNKSAAYAGNPLFAGNPGDTALKTFTVGASFQAGPARLYGNWSRTKQPLATGLLQGTQFDAFQYGSVGSLNNDKADLYELGVDYAVTAPLHLLASVQYNKLNFVNAGSGKLTQYNLGTDYWLSKRTDVYAFVSHLRAKDAINPGIFGDTTGNSDNQTGVAVGIRHKF